MTKKNATTAKPAPKAAAPRPKAKNAARANVAGRVAKPTPPQDHEVPSPKEVANDAHLAAYGKAAKPGKPGKPPKVPHVSALNAAVLVLVSAPAEGLTAKAMIEQMAEQKLWASPKGKTPEASLYAAITREIGRKGKQARFKKVDRGHFVLAGEV